MLAMQGLWGNHADMYLCTPQCLHAEAQAAAQAARWDARVVSKPVCKARKLVRDTPSCPALEELATRMESSIQQQKRREAEVQSSLAAVNKREATITQVWMQACLYTVVRNTCSVLCSLWVHGACWQQPGDNPYGGLAT